jgi:hypothetical protein
LELRGKIAETLLPGKYEYLLKACALMSNGELVFSGVLELSRFMTSLKFMGSKVTPDEIWFLARKGKCGGIEEDGEDKKKLISFQAFLKGLRKALPEINEMFNERSKYLYEVEN